MENNDTCSFVKSQDQRIDLLTYKEDYFGALFNFEHPSSYALESLNFVVHTGQTSKEYAIRFNHYPLLTEVWILEGDDRIYYSENPAIASPFYKNQNPLPLIRLLTVPVLTIIGVTKGN